MGQINEGAEIFAASCTNCKHPRISHMKTTHRDEQRANPRTIRRSDSECKECKKEGKVCKQFKPKK